jgi:transcriptional regulator with XRE-family HTH domain
MNDVMTLGELIRKAREQLGWTQSRLAQRLGVTPGFVTKIEKNGALPSYDLQLVLANELLLDREQLLSLAAQLRQESAHQRILTRGASVQGSYGLAGQTPTPRGHPSQAEQIGQKVMADPDLKRAFTWLLEALANSDRKQAVLQMLEAFAQPAKTAHKTDPPIVQPAKPHVQPVKD